MDLDRLLREWREAEQRSAIGWAGALGQRDPAAALREVLRREQSSSHAVVEAKVRMEDPQARLLFVTLCKRYGLRVYRGPRQRRGTYMVEGPQTFVQQVFWPLFNACAEHLRAELNRSMLRLMAELAEGAQDEDAAELA